MAFSVEDMRLHKHKCDDACLRVFVDYRQFLSVPIIYLNVIIHLLNFQENRRKRKIQEIAL